ncbi:unnamed protein product [Callosobruchus maculatus]|uniref:Uncharacterized protein n=1 Tax=Callosobruchus maculatus TaxID=64391 RepID=A0A653CA98_CALMS|nr:unnamed protein product [Callosobruchus maculatus]
MSLLKTIETIAKLPSVKFCIPATNQQQQLRIVQNNASKAVLGGKQIKEGSSLAHQLVQRAQVRPQIRHYHAMTGSLVSYLPTSQGYILPVRSTAPSFMSKDSKGKKGTCTPCQKGGNPCKVKDCKLKKPKNPKAHRCDPDEPEDICKKDSPCQWYPGKRPC